MRTAVGVKANTSKTETIRKDKVVKMLPKNLAHNTIVDIIKCPVCGETHEVSEYDEYFESEHRGDKKLPIPVIYCRNKGRAIVNQQKFYKILVYQINNSDKQLNYEKEQGIDDEIEGWYDIKEKVIQVFNKFSNGEVENEGCISDEVIDALADDIIAFQPFYKRDGSGDIIKQMYRFKTSEHTFSVIVEDEDTCEYYSALSTDSDMAGHNLLYMVD